MIGRHNCARSISAAQVWNPPHFFEALLSFALFRHPFNWKVLRKTPKSSVERLSLSLEFSGFTSSFCWFSDVWKRARCCKHFLNFWNPIRKCLICTHKFVQVADLWSVEDLQAFSGWTAERGSIFSFHQIEWAAQDVRLATIRNLNFGVMQDLRLAANKCRKRFPGGLSKSFLVLL